MCVANLYGRLNPLGGGIVGNPVAAVGDKFIPLESRILTNNHTVGDRIEFQDVKRFWRGNAQAFALPNRVKFNAFVIAKDLASEIDDLAAVFLRQFCLLEELA